MGSQQEWDDRVAAKRKAFRPEARTGFDHQQSGADFESYGIDVSYFDPMNVGDPGNDDGGDKWWGNKIVVQGDADLRDRIVALLNGDY